MQEGKVIAPLFESRVKARIKVITHLFLNLKGPIKHKSVRHQTYSNLTEVYTTALHKVILAKLNGYFFYNNWIYIYVLNKWTRM
jgi:hypothetical protein